MSIVYAQHVWVQVGVGQFGFVMDFQQDFQTQFVCFVHQLAAFFQRKRSRYQQHGVCSGYPCFVELVFIDDEVFAQDGAICHGSRLADEVQPSAEIRFVGQDREGGCSGLRIGGGNGGGFSIGFDPALGG